jgi:hypothetical protein
MGAVFLVLGTFSGCVGIPSLTASPQFYTFSKGRGIQTYRQGMKVVLEAVEAGLADVGAKPVDRHADRHSALIKARSQSGTPIEIRILAQGITTEMTVRFGTWGDRKATDELVEAIDRRLKPNAGSPESIPGMTQPESTPTQERGENG